MASFLVERSISARFCSTTAAASPRRFLSSSSSLERSSSWASRVVRLRTSDSCWILSILSSVLSKLNSRVMLPPLESTSLAASVCESCMIFSFKAESSPV